MVIKVEHLIKIYGDIKAVNDISFQVNPGDDAPGQRRVAGDVAIQARLDLGPGHDEGDREQVGGLAEVIARQSIPIKVE